MPSLPLTCFEEYFFWEDRPAYPCDIFLRLRFRGAVETGRFEAALRQVFPRHPFLQSRVEVRRGKCWWVPVEHPPPIVWESSPLPTVRAFPRHEPLDLLAGRGMTLYGVLGPEGSDIVAHLHHSCCDGAGILSFLHDVLWMYAHGPEASSALPSLDPNLLPVRGKSRLGWWDFGKLLRKQLIGLQGVKQFLQRQPVPLVPHTPRGDSEGTANDYPAALRHVFSLEETVEIQQAARNRLVTSNDLMARDLFLSLVRWRRDQGWGDDQQWLRLMVPKNMRIAGDEFMPAANVVSSVFLDRRGVDARDPQALLGSIHDELELIKRQELGWTFLMSLTATRWLPGGLKRAARQDRCSISSVFTNLGTIWGQSPLADAEGKIRAGDLVLEDFQVLAPLRPYTCATFATWRYAGRLGVDMHFDSRTVSGPAAERLLEMFVAALHESRAVS